MPVSLDELRKRFLLDSSTIKVYPMFVPQTLFQADYTSILESTTKSVQTITIDKLQHSVL